MKHVGKYGEKPCVVVFREIPNEPENCLVVAPKFLSADYQDSLQKAVESPEGQTSNELGEYLPRQMFADGVNMMGYLHNNNFIKKTSTDHQIRHFSQEVIDKFKRMTRRKKKKEVDYSKVMDDEETITRIRADINKGFITPDSFNNKKQIKNKKDL